LKQSVSHYVMPDEKEEVTAELVHRLGLDGIENLIYGDEPSSNLFTSLTVGAHLRFWPRWMDFYLGNTKRYKKQFPDEKALTAYYGASDTDGWLEEIRKNIRAALAEQLLLYVQTGQAAEALAALPRVGAGTALSAHVPPSGAYGTRRRRGRSRTRRSPSHRRCTRERRSGRTW